MKHLYSKEEVEKAVKQNLSIAGVCRYFNIRPTGGNYKTIHRLIKEYDIDTSHFTGQAWNKGANFKYFGRKFELSDILIRNSNYRAPARLKKRLVSEGLKEYKCECCGATAWMGSKIPLELHHINGDNMDNRLENLQFLCPNCHAITDTYRGKNARSALSERRDVEFRKFKEALTGDADGNLEPSQSNLEGAETRHEKPKSQDMVKE